MAHLVLSPKGRYNSSSKSSRSVRPQRLLAYAAGAFALVLLVAWLRSGSSSSQQHQQQVAAAGRKHYGLAGSTPTAAAAADHQQLERQYQQWLSTFKASDAAYQDYCTAGGSECFGVRLLLLTADCNQSPLTRDSRHHADCA
jgi:hypothetical protein